MKKHEVVLSIMIIVIFSSMGCELLDSNNEQEANVVRRDNKTFMVDRTGKSWDVTHAQGKYGFVPENFQFGLGPFAITPILNPRMLSRGENGYPSDANESQVIGTTLNSDTRAYPLNVLSRHEVADEQFGDTYVAVAY